MYYFNFLESIQKKEEGGKIAQQLNSMMPKFFGMSQSSSYKRVQRPDGVCDLCLFFSNQRRFLYVYLKLRALKRLKQSNTLMVKKKGLLLE